MTVSKSAPVAEAKVRGWVTEFQRDPPLHQSFPVTLKNGKLLPGVHVVCSKCRNRISGDRVHGRTVQSLPHVLTVSVNGFCAECDRLTHIDCRFRADGSQTIVEWLGAHGQWHAKEMRLPTLADKVSRWLRAITSGSSSNS